MNESILMFESQFDSNVKVIIIFPNDEKYQELKPLFNELGFGFVAPNENLVIIDGDIFNPEDIDIHLLQFIEAHELAHIMLNHNTRNPEDEMDADLYAFILLGGMQYDKAQRYLIDSFEQRHGVPFEMSMIEKFK